MESAKFMVFATVFIGAYLLPWIVAASRNHHQRDAICMLTLFGGWTGVGWLAALVWACTEVRTPRKQAWQLQREDSAQKTCANCGALASYAHRFCTSCGARAA